MNDPAPMTLANMRAMGIRNVSVHCRCCRVAAAVDAITDVDLR